MLLLVTFLATLTVGQTGRQVNTVRGSGIVDKGRIWKLEKIFIVMLEFTCLRVVKVLIIGI